MDTDSAGTTDEKRPSHPPTFRPGVILVALCIIFAIGAGFGAVGWLLTEKEPNFTRGTPALFACLMWIGLAYRGIKKMRNEGGKSL